MNVYKGLEILKAPTCAGGYPTWYWIKQHENDTPRLAPVYSTALKKHGIAFLIALGYCEEIIIYPDQPDISDSIDTVSIYGPVPTVKDF